MAARMNDARMDMSCDRDRDEDDRLEGKISLAYLSSMLRHSCWHMNEKGFPLLDFIESVYSAMGQFMVSNHPIRSAVLVMLSIVMLLRIVFLVVARRSFLSAMVISLGMLDGAISKNPPPLHPLPSLHPPRCLFACLPDCLNVYPPVSSSLSLLDCDPSVRPSASVNSQKY